MLKQIIQTGHQNIRGVIKFKDSMVYANPRLSGFTLPQNEEGSVLFECHRGGHRVAEHTSGELVSKSSEMWNNYFSKSAGDIDDGSLFNVEVRNA